MDPIIAITALGATARLTRLLGRDTITYFLRDWLARKSTPQNDDDTPPALYGWLNDLIVCPWCLSIWIAAVVAPAALLYGDHLAYLWPAGLLTLSWLTGLAARHLDPA
ncbi:DUF1360 domain-containing protein [Streptomyces noursei]